jgi:hypothetical protein
LWDGLCGIRLLKGILKKPLSGKKKKQKSHQRLKNKNNPKEVLKSFVQREETKI